MDSPIFASFIPFKQKVTTVFKSQVLFLTLNNNNEDLKIKTQRFFLNSVSVFTVPLFKKKKMILQN